MYDCHNRKQSYGNLETQVASMLDAANAGDIKTSDSIARKIYEESLREGDELHEAYGLYGMGLFSGKEKDSTRKSYLLKSAEKAEKLDNDTLLSRVYNALGSYATGVNHDFNEARRYFTMAEHHARKAHSLEYEIKARCNLSEVLRQMHDTVDIKGDLEVYEYAKKLGNRRLLNAAAHHCAYYYLRDKTQADKALPFIECLGEMGNTSLHDVLMLEYCIKKDSIAGARHYVDKRLSTDSTSAIALYNNGYLLHLEGRYAESIAELKRASAAFGNNRIFETEPPSLTLLQALNYEKLNQPENACQYYSQYIAIRDSADVVRTSSDAARFKILYDLDIKDRDIERQRQTNMRIELLAGFLSLIIVAGGSGIWYYSYRKRQYIRLIVRQNEEYARSLSNMADYISELENNLKTRPDASIAEAKNRKDKYENPHDETDNDADTRCNSGMSNVTMTRIWHTVESLMTAGGFRDPSLTRDSFADKVGCNHTYLSSVIKKKTGLTFQHYLNNLRIADAIRLLSSTEDPGGIKEVAAKVGFTSLSTFYSAFRAKTGISPAQYRKTFLSINSTRDPEIEE